MMSVDEEAYASRDVNMTKLRNALLAAESSENERRPSTYPGLTVRDY